MRLLSKPPGMLTHRSRGMESMPAVRLSGSTVSRIMVSVRGGAFASQPIAVIQTHHQQGDPAGAIPGLGGGSADRLQGGLGILDRRRRARAGSRQGLTRIGDGNARELGDAPGEHEIAHGDKGQVGSEQRRQQEDRQEGDQKPVGFFGG